MNQDRPLDGSGALRPVENAGPYKEGDGFFVAKLLRMTEELFRFPCHSERSEESGPPKEFAVS